MRAVCVPTDALAIWIVSTHRPRMARLLTFGSWDALVSGMKGRRSCWVSYSHRWSPLSLLGGRIPWEYRKRLQDGSTGLWRHHLPGVLTGRALDVQDRQENVMIQPGVQFSGKRGTSLQLIPSLNLHYHYSLLSLARQLL